ncbi:NUDIX hydrolase [Paenibacillus physcomitrellae]|uniref:ADP-ribose diphosphatase n=1 Tax=Paenibacillus physcomitrellae TaxID=1619311 RepID=A0ABQ1FNM6_9BACL|nr:NUDIX hydrolase [Paenibacillus physcomitrellae]GGA22607.1 ADP-ribose diphosphatase [Paenibacillus physcomitrellae]
MNPTSSEHLKEKWISTEPIFQGKVINVQIDTVELPDGSQGKREIVKHPGAVAVLAAHEGKLLLVDQYRQAMGRCELEIPAGKLEKGEDPMEAAKRELEEETGYRCGTIRLLHSFYTSPGFADEIIHLYVAENLTEGEVSPDEDEFLEIYRVTLEEARQFIAEGRIADAKTLLAVYMWQFGMAGESAES